MKKIIFLCICLLMFTTSCAQEAPKITEEAKEAYSVNEEIWNISMQTMHLLKNKNMKELSNLVHPKKGLVLSPDAYIKDGIVQVLTRENIVNFFEDKNLYTWGYQDGSGLPIELTKKEYYTHWIYDKDFINADQIGINTIIGKGNSTQNHKEVFPDGYFVEYHFKGFEEKFEGIDWESLRLVFEKYEGQWYLVAIIHDHWTI